MNIAILETWYLDHHRKLPFRGKDPYQIWVSEIMLQQTQVETVLPFFERFIKRYPTVRALSQTDDETLKKQVEGLGYYRRFSHMLRAAKIMVEQHQGNVPNTYQDLIALPGIGEYTAGAILSIAYQLPYAATDGNVIRVLSRYYGIKDDMALVKNRKKITALHQSLIEQAHPEIYTQAVMELGALICKPKKPQCQICPIRASCIAYQQNATSEYPVISKTKSNAVFQWMTMIVLKEGSIALRKRQETLLEGMYEYPQYEKTTIENWLSSMNQQGVMFESVTYLLRVSHVFSHQRWEMEVYVARLKGSKHPDWVMVPLSDQLKYPMATAHRKISLSDILKKDDENA